MVTAKSSRKRTRGPARATRKPAGTPKKRGPRARRRKSAGSRPVLTKRKAAPAGRQATPIGGVNEKSERVVVDEIMEERARILRAPRLPGFADSDLGIETWGEEVEDAITTWKLEAYVGFRAPRRLKEGDVFFIRDGSTLNESYKGRKVMRRDLAAERHLVEAADDSREQARKEIKERVYNLTAQRVSRNKRDRDNLARIIRMRVWKGSR
jgi:hypothetical protein